MLHAHVMLSINHKNEGCAQACQADAVGSAAVPAATDRKYQKWFVAVPHCGINRGPVRKTGVSPPIHLGGCFFEWAVGHGT